MQITQEGLQTLSAILTEGTFDAAAQKLHVTPSAVSQRIKALESAVGRVVVRRTKPITATPDGEILIRLARQWELLLDEARTELVGEQSHPDADEPGRTRIRLTIATNADSLATWLLPALATAHRQLPIVTEVLRGDETRSGEFLKTGDAIGAITSDPIRIRGCTLVPLGSMRYFPIATKEFADTHFPDGLTAGAIERAPMVMFDRDDHLQRQVLGMLADSPLEPPIVYIPASTEYRRSIELGIGWGAVPTLQLPDDLAAAGMTRIGKRHIDVPLYWQYWSVSSPVVSALTEIIVDDARRALVAPGAGATVR